MHVAEAGFVDGDGLSAKLAFGSFFAEANAGQFRLGEHRCGHQVMVHRAAAIGEEGIGNSPALIDGHGCQVDAIGDITNGIDVRNVGALMGINSNAMPVVGNARLLQCQRFQKGFAAGGLQDHISFESGISAAQHHAAVGLLDG